MGLQSNDSTGSRAVTPLVCRGLVHSCMSTVTPAVPMLMRGFASVSIILNQLVATLKENFHSFALQDELGFSEDQTRRMIRTYDRNADNKLNYEEFIWFYWKIQEK